MALLSSRKDPGCFSYVPPLQGHEPFALPTRTAVSLKSEAAHRPLRRIWPLRPWAQFSEVNLAASIVRSLRPLRAVREAKCLMNCV